MRTTRSKLAMLGIAAAAGGGMLGLAGTSFAQGADTTAPSAVTAPAAPSTAPDTGTESPDTENETPDPALAAKAKITEAQATAAALGAQPDGKVVHAEVEDENGTIVWSVELSTPNGEHEVKVDANTGTVIASEAEGTEVEDSNESEAEDGPDTPEAGDTPDAPEAGTTTR